MGLQVVVMADMFMFVFVCVCVEVQVRYAGGIGRGVTRETDEERWSNTTQNALAPPLNTYLCKGIKQARKLRAMPDQNYRYANSQAATIVPEKECILI